uniref:Uncharacterized protein n=1 Tax=Anguilla anguilla TaxID=7936 RepID=A0A0E9PZC1_ANGAN
MALLFYFTLLMRADRDLHSTSLYSLLCGVRDESKQNPLPFTQHSQALIIHHREGDLFALSGINNPPERGYMSTLRH